MSRAWRHARRLLLCAAACFMLGTTGSAAAAPRALPAPYATGDATANIRLDDDTKRVTVGETTRKIKGAGKVKAFVRISKRARARLRRGRSVKLVLSTEVVSADGKRIPIDRTVKLTGAAGR